MAFHQPNAFLAMNINKMFFLFVDVENAVISASKYDDINTITSALKLYFRLLPIPLVSFDVYKQLLDAISKNNLQVYNGLSSGAMGR